MQIIEAQPRRRRGEVCLTELSYDLGDGPVVFVRYDPEQGLAIESVEICRQFGRTLGGRFCKARPEAEGLAAVLSAPIPEVMPQEISLPFLPYVKAPHQIPHHSQA